MTGTVIRDGTVFDEKFSAVIIYDKSDFAKEAKAMLERVAKRTDESARWNVKPWRAGLLKDSPTAEAALMEAAEAQLVLLAVRQVQSILPWLVDWLERWATCRRVPEAALGVWDCGNTDIAFARTVREFSHFTGRHGLSLIFDDNQPVDDQSSMFVSDLREREVSLTSTIHQIMEEPLHNHLHWGVDG